ncbi:MAG: 2-dehydro-3-deoxygalactonokinase, partial [Ferruginibacter sp.]
AGARIIANETEQLFIFPGTHSKHLSVKNGMVTSITTYMTGELFDLLSSKSILSASVKKNERGDNSPFFIEGVIKGTGSNLTNSIFHVRTNHLFNKITSFENYDYLSGLLIGHELKEIARDRLTAITRFAAKG